MKNHWNNLWQDTRGQGMVEFAFILSIVSLAAILILPQIGNKVVGFFESARDAFLKLR